MTNEEIEKARRAWEESSEYPEADYGGWFTASELDAAFTAGAHFYRDEMVKRDDGFDEWEQMEEWHDVLVLDAADTEPQSLALYQAARTPLIARIAQLEAELARANAAQTTQEAEERK